MSNTRKRAATLACCAASAAAALLVGVTHSSAAAATPPVTVAANLDSALGIHDYLATSSQLAATSQAVLNQTNDALDQAYNLLGLNSDGQYPTGYAGSVANPATGSLDIWWHGGGVNTMLTTLETELPKLKFTVHDATYDRNSELAAIAANRDKMTGADLVFPKEDGSGIVVTHNPGSSVDGASIAAMTGFPVTVVEDGAGVNLSGGRQADVDPHNGGGMMKHADASGVYYCSTGFSVLSGAYGRLLSAAHCDLSGNWGWGNNGGTTLTPGGSSVSVAAAADSMIIDPNGGTSGFIYTGGPNSTSRAAVAGSDTNNVGELVATGGAESGEHRGATIINDAYSGSCNGYSCTLDVAETSDASVLAAQGDSGGPVYHTDSDGRVTAKGIILQGVIGDEAGCGSLEIPGATCYYRIRYYPIRPLLNLWGVDLETHS